MRATQRLVLVHFFFLPAGKLKQRMRFTRDREQSRRLGCDYQGSACYGQANRPNGARNNGTVASYGDEITKTAQQQDEGRSKQNEHCGSMIVSPLFRVSPPPPVSCTPAPTRGLLNN